MFEVALGIPSHHKRFPSGDASCKIGVGNILDPSLERLVEALYTERSLCWSGSELSPFLGRHGVCTSLYASGKHPFFMQMARRVALAAHVSYGSCLSSIGLHPSDPAADSKFTFWPTQNRRVPFGTSVSPTTPLCGQYCLYLPTELFQLGLEWVCCLKTFFQASRSLWCMTLLSAVISPVSGSVMVDEGILLWFRKCL